MKDINATTIEQKRQAADNVRDLIRAANAAISIATTEHRIQQYITVTHDDDGVPEIKVRLLLPI